MSKTSTTLPIVPIKLDDVTSNWISGILGKTISDTNFTIETNIQSGNGFRSNLLRVKCQSESQTLSLIVKLLPVDDKSRKRVIVDKYFEKELTFYQEILPDLLTIFPDLERYLCRFNYGRIQERDPSLDLDHASVVVLEDLKPEGYYTINFDSESQTENLDEIITFLAKFHYGSMVLEERKGTRLDEVYELVQRKVFFEMAKKGLATFHKILVENNADEGVRESIRKLIPYSDVIIKKIQEAVQNHPCLIHGDLWSNNLMLNDNTNLPTKVIDWQLLAYLDPTTDLAVMIISNLPVAKLTKENVDRLLQLYHNALIEQLESKSLSQVLKRDWEAFSKSFYTWGMAFTLTWFLTDSEPFTKSYPRVVKVFEFLVKDMNVAEFLLDHVKKMN